MQKLRNLRMSDAIISFVLPMAQHIRRTTVTMGRGIRRLVTLFDSLDDLVDEADQQFQNNSDDAEPNDEEFVDNETHERQRE